MSDWNPALYTRFEAERTRPAVELLARVPLEAGAVHVAVDLGCGPGNSTELVAQRFPAAAVTGIDNSSAMLQAAAQRLPGHRFELADIGRWSPAAPPQLIFANAALQWLPDQDAQLPRLFALLSPGGVLAVQVPDNLDEPSHRLMRETAVTGPWAKALRHAAGLREVIRTPDEYYTLLKPHCQSLDIWHTAYNHVLDGVQGIVEFVITTGLRPYLDPMDETMREKFVDAYRASLAKAYPAVPGGKVLMRFPRIFLVAQT
jgi:trans-aconitate 2-methyltransferase